MLSLQDSINLFKYQLAENSAKKYFNGKVVVFNEIILIILGSLTPHETLLVYKKDSSRFFKKSHMKTLSP